MDVPKDAKLSPSWQCPECKVLTLRKDNTEDPVRSEGSDYGFPFGTPVSSNDVIAEILKEVRLHRAETESFREDFDALRSIVERYGA